MVHFRLVISRMAKCQEHHKRIFPWVCELRCYCNLLQPSATIICLYSSADGSWIFVGHNHRGFEWFVSYFGTNGARRRTLGVCWHDAPKTWDVQQLCFSIKGSPKIQQLTNFNKLKNPKTNYGRSSSICVSNNGQCDSRSKKVQVVVDGIVSTGAPKNELGIKRHDKFKAEIIPKPSKTKVSFDVVVFVFSTTLFWLSWFISNSLLISCVNYLTKSEIQDWKLPIGCSLQVPFWLQLGSLGSLQWGNCCKADQHTNCSESRHWVDIKSMR